MQTAQDIMTTDVITVNPETEIVQAARILLENRINGLPVVDDQDRLVGIVCQSDLIAQQKRVRMPSLFTFLDGYISLTSARHFEREIEKIAASQVRQAMTPDPASISPDTAIDDAAGQDSAIDDAAIADSASSPGPSFRRAAARPPPPRTSLFTRVEIVSSSGL